LAEAELGGALKADRQEHVVTVAIEAARAEDAVAIGQALVALIKANGLRYWGDSRATPDQPGLNVGVLDLPEQATLLNGPRAIAIDTALRDEILVRSSFSASCRRSPLTSSRPRPATAGAGDRGPTPDAT